MVAKEFHTIIGQDHNDDCPTDDDDEKDDKEDDKEDDE